MQLLATNQIQLDQDEIKSKFKKITGTRFANCLGLSPWQTPFQVWCEVTKTYEPPFTDSKYTLAGKTIEPKQLAYVEQRYFKGKVITPTMKYGADYFNKTYGDFFKDNPIFGGMWDSLVVDEVGGVLRVIECKTTSRAEDWGEDVPEYYAMQASLYAYLLGIDEVVMVVSFLEDKDYPIEQNGSFDISPAEKYICSKENTVIVPFKVSERFPDINLRLEAATNFYNNHCKTGLSPVFDKVKDKEYLDALLNKCANPDSSLDELIKERENLLVEVNKLLEPIKSTIDDKTARIDVIEAQIKDKLKSQFTGSEKKIEYSSNSYVYAVTKSSKTGVDTALLKKDGLYEKYSKQTESITFTKTLIKEEQ